MIVSHRDARAVERGQKRVLRLPQTRSVPTSESVVPLVVRIPNADIGYDSDGAPKLESVTVCHVLIGKVEAALLEDVAYSEVYREGYRSKAEFLELWHDAYLAKTEQHMPIWRIQVSIDRTCRPRFLSQGVIEGKQGDYVTNPYRGLKDAGEAVDEEVIEAWATQARRDSEQREAFLRKAQARAPLQAQLEELEEECRQRHIDARDDLRLIKKALIDFNDQPLVERKLRELRARLSRVPA